MTEIWTPTCLVKPCHLDYQNHVILGWDLNPHLSSKPVDIQESAIPMRHKGRPTQSSVCLFHCRYTRNLVDAGNDKFNLMILCWGEGHGSSVHDHADAHCFMKMLDGSLTETRFAWPQGSEEVCDNVERPLEVISKTQLKLNDVCYINGKKPLLQTRKGNPFTAGAEHKWKPLE